jgi:hypothetical protein
MYSGRYINILSPTVAGTGGSLPENFTLDDIPDGSYYGRIALSELTESGTLIDHSFDIDGAVVTLTFPDTLIKSSYMPVQTKTTVTGVRINFEQDVDGTTFNYDDFYNYLVGRGMTVSGVTVGEMSSYIYDYFYGPGTDNEIVSIYINEDLTTFSGTTLRGEHVTYMDGTISGTLVIDGGEV